MNHTWEELVAIEPGLKALLQEAEAVDGSSGATFCANHIWYRRGGLKDRMLKLVGWTAKNPVLRNADDYHVAYQKIYWALPGCRHEEGLCW